MVVGFYRWIKKDVSWPRYRWTTIAAKKRVSLRFFEAKSTDSARIHGPPWASMDLGPPKSSKQRQQLIRARGDRHRLLCRTHRHRLGDASTAARVGAVKPSKFAGFSGPSLARRHPGADLRHDADWIILDINPPSWAKIPAIMANSGLIMSCFNDQSSTRSFLGLGCIYPIKWWAQTPSKFRIIPKDDKQRTFESSHLCSLKLLVLSYRHCTHRGHWTHFELHLRSSLNSWCTDT